MVWYLAIRRELRPRKEWTVSLEDHLNWMRQQHEAGSILFSGPSPDRTLGIYVIRAASQEQAAEIAAGDPYTKGGCTTFDLYPWEIHQILGVGNFTPSR